MLKQEISIIKPDGSIKKMKGTIQDKRAYIISKFTKETPESLYEVMTGDRLIVNNLECEIINVRLNKSVSPNYLYYILF